MKNLFISVVCLMSLNSFAADCYDQITAYGSYSSRVFKLESSEYPEYDKLVPKVAADIINTLIQRETNCNFKKVSGDIKHITCLKFPKSGVTCEIPTSIGYFILHRNSFGSFDHSIMYTRWD